MVMTEERALDLGRAWGEVELDKHADYLAGLYLVEAHASKRPDGTIDGTPIGGLAVHVQTVPPSRIDAIVIAQDYEGREDIITSPWFNHCEACGKSALFAIDR